MVVQMECLNCSPVLGVAQSEIGLSSTSSDMFLIMSISPDEILTDTGESSPGF